MEYFLDGDYIMLFCHILRAFFYGIIRGGDIDEGRSWIHQLGDKITHLVEGTNLECHGMPQKSARQPRKCSNTVFEKEVWSIVGNCV